MRGFFFGRSAEVERLAAVAYEPVALVYGLPGIGKSELAYHAVGQLLAAPPWDQAKVTRFVLEPHHTGALHGFLFARLAGHGSGAGQGSGDLRALVALLTRERHVVVIDDAHIAATEVASLVDAFVREPHPASRVVVTSRTALPTITTPIIIKLGPLSPDDTGALGVHLAKRLGVPVEDLAALVDRSRGSPLVLRHLISGHYRGTGGEDPIRETIAALDAETRQALVQLAAVAGCSQSRLAASRLIADERVFDVLSEQCLIESGPDRLVVHGLVRDIVMRDADPSVVDVSRRTAAQVLWERHEHRNCPNAAVEAICLSASAGDLERALARLGAATRSISGAGLDHLLVPLLERLGGEGHAQATSTLARIFVRMGRIHDAERTLAQLPPSIERDLSTLVTRATIAERNCRLGAAAADLAAAIELAPDARRKTLLQMRLVIVETLAGHVTSAARLVEQIERGGHLESDVDRVRLCWMHGIRHALRLDWTECLAVVAEGRRLAQRAGAADLDLSLVLLELLAASELGDVARSSELAEEVQRIKPGGHLRRTMADLYVGISQLACGQVAQAVVTLGRAFKEHESQHDELLAAVAGHFLGRALMLHGDGTRSLDILAAVAQRAASAGLFPLVGPGEIFLARALLQVGRLAEAVAIAEPLLASDQSPVVGEAHAVLGYARAFSGDIAGARDKIQLALASAGDREPLRTDLVLDQAHMELMGGDPERARAGALSVVEDEARRSRPYAAGRALFVIAVADLAAGLVDTAIETLAEIDSLATEHGLHLLRARVALLRSATSHQGGSILERVPAEQQRGYIGILRVLGLRSDTVIVTSQHGRVHTDATKLKEYARRHDLLIDISSGTILGRSGKTVEGRGVAAAILVALAESAEPVSAERLYQVVWGGHDYHPLRHRNTLYIALNRTRKLLESIDELREVIRRDGSGWAIAPEIDVAVARRDPRVSTVTIQRIV